MKKLETTRHAHVPMTTPPGYRVIPNGKGTFTTAYYPDMSKTVRPLPVDDVVIDVLRDAASSDGIVGTLSLNDIARESNRARMTVWTAIQRLIKTNRIEVVQPFGQRTHPTIYRVLAHGEAD